MHSGICILHVAASIQNKSDKYDNYCCSTLLHSAAKCNDTSSGCMEYLCNSSFNIMFMSSLSTYLCTHADTGGLVAVIIVPTIVEVIIVVTAAGVLLRKYVTRRKV